MIHARCAPRQLACAGRAKASLGAEKQPVCSFRQLYPLLYPGVSSAPELINSAITPLVQPKPASLVA
jgi:hypothetical protein